VNEYLLFHYEKFSWVRGNFIKTVQNLYLKRISVQKRFGLSFKIPKFNSELKAV